MLTDLLVLVVTVSQSYKVHYHVEAINSPSLIRTIVRDGEYTFRRTPRDLNLWCLGSLYFLWVFFAAIPTNLALIRDA